MKKQNEKQLEIVNDLIARSLTDSKFKKDFIDDPKGVIESYYQFKVYDDIKLTVEDQSDESVIYLNIPRKQDINTLELTEEQLEQVAGGGTPGIILTGMAACALYDFGCGVIDGIRN